MYYLKKENIMRHYVILLLVTTIISAMTAEAPVFLVRNGEPYVCLAPVAPVIGMKITYDSNMKSGLIKSDMTSEDYYVENIAKKIGNQNYLTFFPEYPYRLYISKNGFDRFQVISHFDKKNVALIIFNTMNGFALELNKNTDIQSLATLKASPEKPVNWDTIKLKELIKRKTGLLKDIGSKLLYSAIKNGDIPALTVLLDAGLSPNIANKDVSSFSSPLEQAIGYNQSKMALFLLSHGATPTPDAFMRAVSENDAEVVKVMLDYKVNPNTTNNFGWTALHNAAFYRNIEIVKLLVKHGAKVDARNLEQETPLLLATKPMQIGFGGEPTETIIMMSPDEIHQVADYFISAGADINAQDNASNSVIYNSVRMIDLHLYRLLRERADLKPLDKTARSKLLLALLGSAVTFQYQMRSMLPIEAELAKELDDFNRNGNHTPEHDEQRAKLHIAMLKNKASKDLPEIFSDLLVGEIDFHLQDENDLNKATMLNYAIQLRDITFARKLIDAGADVNFNYPIFSAVQSLNPEGVRLLIEKGVNINLYSPYLDLDRRSISGYLDKEEKLLNHDDTLALAKIFVQRKVDMTIRDEESGGQAIHHAVKTGYPDLVELLLDNGANIEATDNDGTTPLGIAALFGETEIMALLIKRGAKVNIYDKNSNTPLSFSLEYRNMEGIKLLLAEPGIVVTKKDKNGCTSLMLAVYNQYSYDSEEYEKAYKKWLPTLADELLKRGCKVNDVDNDKRTALHYASLNDHIEYTKSLISHGANVNITDKDGNTPLHLAKRDKTSKLALYLRSYQEKLLKKK